MNQVSFKKLSWYRGAILFTVAQKAARDEIPPNQR
jgi:hypothetical protein